MEGLQALSQDKRLRNHLNVDKKRRSNHHWQSSPHFHSYYEMYFMQEGRCKFFVGESVFPLDRGEMLLIPPGELHLCRYEEEGLHDRFTVYFDAERLTPDLLAYLPFDLSDPKTPVHFKVNPENVEDINFLLNQMLEAYHMNTEYGERINSHLFPVFLLFLNAHSKPLTDKIMDSPVEQAIERTVRFIGEHYMDSLTLDEAASVAGFTPSYFSRKFKEIEGLGFREYLTHLRLKKGAKLLRDSRLSVQEIADACGFSSANYFGDVFKSMYHLSPRQYRQMDEVSDNP